jgi:hypothetical protein
VSPAPATRTAPAGSGVPLGPPVPKPAAPVPAGQRGWWQQAGDAAWSFIDGPVTMRPLDGDVLTTAGMTRFEATFVGRKGPSVYDAVTGKKISGDGPASVPSWQRPIPPAMLLIRSRVPVPAGAGRLVPALP